MLDEGEFQDVTWSYFELDEKGNISTTKQTESVDATALNNLIKEMDTKSKCIRNEQDRIPISFVTFDERDRQNEILLSTILRAMKDIASIGLASPSGN